MTTVARYGVDEGSGGEAVSEGRLGESSKHSARLAAVVRASISRYPCSSAETALRHCASSSSSGILRRWPQPCPHPPRCRRRHHPRLPRRPPVASSAWYPWLWRWTPSRTHGCGAMRRAPGSAAPDPSVQDSRGARSRRSGAPPRVRDGWWCQRQVALEDDAVLVVVPPGHQQRHMWYSANLCARRRHRTVTGDGGEPGWTGGRPLLRTGVCCFDRRRWS